MDREEKKQVMSTNRDFDLKEEEEEEVPLPGFRFHPTDEELVGFYLHRKVENKPIAIQLIKQIDIYKYDPWDLPKIGGGRNNNVGEMKEWYFFCRRGRKYRNSVRPNRVTGCGFWKATGIDRPIYSSSRDICIGLKKSLVFYRGTAGKGTKTDWMMHEFRLPPHPHDQQPAAEVWTLCRILKRNGCDKKALPEWREIANNNNDCAAKRKRWCSSGGDDDDDDEVMQSYISFQAAAVVPSTGSTTSTSSGPPIISANPNVNEVVLLKHGNWDDLRSVLQFADDPIFFV